MSTLEALVRLVTAEQARATDEEERAAEVTDNDGGEMPDMDPTLPFKAAYKPPTRSWISLGWAYGCFVDAWFDDGNLITGVECYELVGGDTMGSAPMFVVEFRNAPAETVARAIAAAVNVERLETA